MKNFFQTLLLLLVIGIIGYHVKGQLFPPPPCSQPIPYNIGTFDTQFGISKAYFLSALADAEAIWEKPSGINLFDYSPGDTNPNDLKINLVYDYRQQATTKLNNIGASVKTDQAQYDMLKAQYDELKTEIQNTRDIDQKNAKIDQLNALVPQLNALAERLNLSVETYNNTNDSHGESFEEGLYSTDGTTTKIDIYEFSNRDKLVRVLAHELGHALGMEHVDDPKAIMYALNQGTNESATKADINELDIVCKIK